MVLDESGIRASDRFTVGGLKVRRPGQLSRALRHLRDKHGFEPEFKFNNVNDGSLPFYVDVIDTVAEQDVQVIGCVVDPDANDPFAHVSNRWLAHADVCAQLLVGSINRRELVAVLLDGITTPRDCSLEDTVRMRVNKRFGSISVVSAVSLDSRTNDMLQVADLVASSIAFERRRLSRGVGSSSSAKGRVAARLGAAIGNVGLLDGRSPKYNIATYRRRRSGAKTGLRVVQNVRSA